MVPGQQRIFSNPARLSENCIAVNYLHTVLLHYEPSGMLYNSRNTGNRNW